MMGFVMAFLCIYIHHSFSYFYLIHFALPLFVFLSPNSLPSCFLVTWTPLPSPQTWSVGCFESADQSSLWPAYLFTHPFPTSVNYMWMHIDFVQYISKKEIWTWVFVKSRIFKNLWVLIVSFFREAVIATWFICLIKVRLYMKDHLHPEVYLIV